MASRRYDKGEKRYKHEGSGPEAEIHFDKNRPRKWIGRCPAGMQAKLRTDLLNHAIAAPSGDRDIAYPKYLYVVHNGVIYEARTSDGGTSYHGFPYRGRLSKKLIEQLRVMAKKKGCLALFEEWVKQHIDLQGSK